jgi:hypothetical protein
MEAVKPKKTLANVRSPIIEAVIHQRFVFASKADALAKINVISERFVRSTLAESAPNDCTVIWIRDYQLSEEEEKAGCIGNYALLYADKTPDGKYTVAARKLTIEAAKHPQRKRQKSKHPDWGYWVLRRVKKNWRYDSIDEAYNDLMQLAEDFPEVSIPGQNKLYTIVYRKTEDGSLPLFRIVLEVEALPQGGFTITSKENTFKREGKPRREEEVQSTADASTTPEQMGRFTSMITVKRNKRRNIGDVRANAAAKAPSEDNGSE